MQNSFRVARIGGIDIFVNWTWLLAVAFITWSLGAYYHQQFSGWSTQADYIVGFLSAILLFVTVLIHELAHSFTARANGLPVRTISLFIFGGVSNLTQEPQTPRIELLVAIAGPLASLILAGIFYGLHALIGNGSSEVGAILGYLAYVNLILAIFNLIPGFPLDGGRVLRAILWFATGSVRRATLIASTIGNWIGYLFILAGILEVVFSSGNLLPGLWLAFIGWFLHNAASASYQQAVMDRVLLGVDVSNVMDRTPATVPPDTPLEALVYRHMLTENQRAVAVTDGNGTLEGLVTFGDTRTVPRQEWSLVPVSRIMTPVAALCTVSPDESLRDALRILAENSYHQLPVVQHGRLVGMLNRAHVVQYLHLRQAMEASTSQPG